MNADCYVFICFSADDRTISRLSSVGRAYDCNCKTIIVWSLVRFRQSRDGHLFFPEDNFMDTLAQ